MELVAGSSQSLAFVTDKSLGGIFMPAVEKRPQDEHAPEQKPVVGPDKWVRKPLANIPWEALAPVSLDHVPMPLGPVPTPDKLPAELFSKPLGLYAETGFQPVKPADPLPREKRIDSYQQTLDGANYAAGNLKGQQKVEYIEDQLDALARFSKDVAPADSTGKAKETVPTPLIDNARPLIEKLERMTPDAETPGAGKNPDGAHIGTGADWNTKLGVPEYRTQSDNLIPPEASCNMTSVAMALGPWLGGLLIDAFGWPGVYWFRVPLALLALVLMPMAVVLPLLGIVLLWWTDSAFDQLLITKVRSDLAVAKGYFERTLGEVGASASAVADSHALHRALADLVYRVVAQFQQLSRRGHRRAGQQHLDAIGLLVPSHSRAGVGPRRFDRVDPVPGAAGPRQLANQLGPIAHAGQVLPVTSGAMIVGGHLLITHGAQGKVLRGPLEGDVQGLSDGVYLVASDLPGRGELQKCGEQSKGILGHLKPPCVALLRSTARSFSNRYEA